VDEVTGELAGGLRSGTSYVGSRDLHEFKARAEFIRITAGKQESEPGDEIDA
jgi:IMP dehydrogenase